MAIKINFDAAHNPEEPTIVLAKRNGDRIGKLNAKEIDVVDNFNDASEISFKVYKYVDGVKDYLWDKITNLKLAYCVEWNQFFEITVEIDESDETIKTVFGTSLGHAELGQIMLYDIEINTETDISRDDYVIPTVLYRNDNPKASLLHRIMEKAPHYTIKHVDSTIANIQRTFTFSDTSIYDAFQDIAEEIHCIFVLDSYLNSDGKLQRDVSVYDLESNCLDCHYRGEFMDVCPKCGSSNIDYYGEDTTIFVTSDELADSLQLTYDVDATKNCFKLEGGDELMTATIRSCNPNGSDYIWYLSDAMKEDMSDELVGRIESYDELYNDYQVNDIPIDASILLRYNDLVNKYKVYNEKLETITTPIKGYSSLIDAYYNTVDLYLYLKSGLMPDAGMDDTSAQIELDKLTAANLSPVSTSSNLRALSAATADNIVLSMAKIIADSRYKIKIADGSTLGTYQNDTTPRVWTGKFIVTNYSDDEDTATGSNVEVQIDTNYANFVKQKVEKALSSSDTKDLSVSGLFKMELSEFKEEIKKYSLNRLSSFHDACQTCIDVLIEQGIADKETWSGEDPNLYDDLYTPYVDKLNAITVEMKVRQDEIDLIAGIRDVDGDLITYGLQNYIDESKSFIQNELDFEKYLGQDLWLEFCSFRREDKYSNDNYISEGLNNAELINKANEFVQVAYKEIYKSAELQRSVSADLKNLLVIPKFAPLVDYFKVGNWIRVMIDDEVYKLRLINYSINYDSLEDISVEFSDTVKANSSVKSVQGILNQASSMATSYSSVKRQAKQGEKSNAIIDNWTSVGLDATNVRIVGGADGQAQSWDSHGMLFREYDSATGEYSPEQMKIINSTIAITDNNWESTKTAIGKYYYVDPITGEARMTYGVNAETIIGRLMLGETLAFANQSGTMTFDENGFAVKNNINTVTIDPNEESIINIKKDNSNIFFIDDDGNLVITGKIVATSINITDAVTNVDNGVAGFSDVAISGSYDDLKDIPTFSAVAKSGSYNDLNNKPTIPDPQVQSDWNVTNKSNIAYIKNKPNLSEVATSGRYDDLIDAPSIPDAQVQVDWDIVDSNSMAYIKNKPALKKVATTGSYNDLTGRPTLSAISESGKYTDLITEENDSGKLLYVGDDGNVTSLSIADLKELLGI